MSDRQELLDQHSFPYVQRGGVTLVSRENAAACVALIYQQGWRFLGYDSFTVTNEFIQPHMECSPDWTRIGQSGAPAMQSVLKELVAHPDVITHYEFVFNSGA